MARAVAHTQADFASVRTGRATPELVNKLKVDYYGAETSLQQLAGIAVLEARTLVITPFDRSSLGAIEKALQASDLGVNPSNDGQVIRLAFPALTAERRKELAKIVRHKGEEGRVALRNARRSSRHDLEALEHEGSISSDELDRAERELDKLTQDHVSEIDRLLQRKEQELLDI
ncbi:MAG: ribosome recycling factor [Acidimicrobiales bacterium]